MLALAVVGLSMPTMPERLHLGIDLGGSKILALLLDDDGHEVARAKKRTKPELGYQGVIERLRSTADEALTEAGAALGREVTAFGLGVPGPVDPRTGAVQGAVNLGWDESPIAADSSRAFAGLPVAVGNDVNFGALGEVVHGAGRGATTAYALFMGTGLGGAYVADGAVVSGQHGFAGELGHIPAPFGQALCTCGQLGCLETVASKVGIGRLIQEALAVGRETTLEDPADLRSSRLKAAWDAGDGVVREAIERAFRALAWGVVVAAQAVDPEVVILGGGVVEAFTEEGLAYLADELERYPYCRRFFDHRLQVAELGDLAVATGAAAAARNLG